jgi:hypothetical protein
MGGAVPYENAAPSASPRSGQSTPAIGPYEDEELPF